MLLKPEPTHVKKSFYSYELLDSAYVQNCGDQKRVVLPMASKKVEILLKRSNFNALDKLSVVTTRISSLVPRHIYRTHENRPYGLALVQPAAKAASEMFS